MVFGPSLTLGTGQNSSVHAAPFLPCGTAATQPAARGTVHATHSMAKALRHQGFLHDERDRSSMVLWSWIRCSFLLTGQIRPRLSVKPQALNHYLRPHPSPKVAHLSATIAVHTDLAASRNPPGLPPSKERSHLCSTD